MHYTGALSRGHIEWLTQLGSDHFGSGMAKRFPALSFPNHNRGGLSVLAVQSIDFSQQMDPQIPL